MTTIAPGKLVLTCTLTGKVVTWTNKKIIQKKIDEFGSLEAFVNQFTCRGAGKVPTAAGKVTPRAPKALSEEERIGKMSLKDYTTKYVAPVEEKAS